jgi:hypothetical protein
MGQEGNAIVAQQSDERQASTERDTKQEPQLELAEHLQPVMTTVQEQIHQIVRESMERALQPLQEDVGRVLDQADDGQRASARSPQEQARRDGGASAQDQAGSPQAPEQPQTQEGQPEAKQAQEGKAEGQQDEGEEDPLVAVLRQQITDAMEPVLDDLRENVEEAVQQQIEHAIDMSDEELHQRVDQAVQPMRQEVEQQVDQTIQDARHEREKPPQTPLQEAIQRTVKALKDTMRWLARTLHVLMKTVVGLLKAVLNLVVVILLALFEGLKALGGAIGGGAKSAGQGIKDVLQKMLLSLGKGALGKLLPGQEKAQA